VNAILSGKADDAKGRNRETGQAKRCKAGLCIQLTVSPAKRGPKTPTPNPLVTEVAQLQRTNARLTQRLARAEAIIDI
jgi:hypothetical protein